MKKIKCDNCFQVISVSNTNDVQDYRNNATTVLVNARHKCPLSVRFVKWVEKSENSSNKTFKIISFIVAIPVVFAIIAFAYELITHPRIIELIFYGLMAVFAIFVVLVLLTAMGGYFLKILSVLIEIFNNRSNK